MLFKAQIPSKLVGNPVKICQIGHGGMSVDSQGKMVNTSNPEQSNTNGKINDTSYTIAEGTPSFYNNGSKAYEKGDTMAKTFGFGLSPSGGYDSTRTVINY